MKDGTKISGGLSKLDRALLRIPFVSRLNINARLTISFLVIILLMLVANGFLLWQSHVMRSQATRLKQIDEQFVEVQRVHNLLLTFRIKLEELARAQDSMRLQSESQDIKRQLSQSLIQTENVFRGIGPENILDPTILPTMQAIQSPLQSQLDTFQALASAGGWEAVQKRVEQQVASVENLSAQLVDTAHEHVDRERAEAMLRINRAQMRAVFILPVAVVITIAVSGLLAVVTTRSIVRPLRSLQAGANALAQGDFDYRVQLAGTDELAGLGSVFNNTIIKLRDLYRELQTSETYLAEAQRLTHMGSWVWELVGREALHLSDEWYRIYGFDPKQGKPGWEERLKRIHPQDRDLWRGTLERAIRDKSDYHVEFRVLLPDGTVKWLQTVGHPVLTGSGELVQFMGSSMDITARKRAEDDLKAAFDEIKKLKDELYNENVALREEIDKISMFEEIVGSSEPLRKVLVEVAKVANTDSTVLILGETGTGKELIARAIHRRSDRASRAFVKVNCAAIPQTLIASELFGHEKGAFTGATQRRLGRFELADGGTIFLDEVGELPPETQVALLRVLQEREFERLGGTQPISIDVRVLTATNRNLQAAVQTGAFRQDLFYRLNVFPIHVPALRERADDIPLLMEYMIDRYSKRTGKKISSITRRTMELFQNYSWPGNIRELQNVVERAVILSDDETFDVDETWYRGPAASMETRLPAPGNGLGRIEPDREREIIEAALSACRGRISGPSGAAARLGIPRQTLESKIARLGIQKHLFRST